MNDKYPHLAHQNDGDKTNDIDTATPKKGRVSRGLGKLIGRVFGGKETVKPLEDDHMEIVVGVADKMMPADVITFAQDEDIEESTLYPQKSGDVTVITKPVADGETSSSDVFLYEPEGDGLTGYRIKTSVGADFTKPTLNVERLGDVHEGTKWARSEDRGTVNLSKGTQVLTVRQREGSNERIDGIIAGASLDSMRLQSKYVDIVRVAVDCSKELAARSAEVIDLDSYRDKTK